MIKRRISKLTNNDLKGLSHIECIEHIYDDTFGGFALGGKHDGGENKKSYNKTLIYKILPDGLYEFSHNTWNKATDVRSISGALRAINDMIETYDVNKKGLPYFEEEYYAVYDEELKGHRTRAPSKKPAVKVDVRKMF